MLDSVIGPILIFPSLQQANDFRKTVGGRCKTIVRSCL